MTETVTAFNKVFEIRPYLTKEKSHSYLLTYNMKCLLNPNLLKTGVKLNESDIDKLNAFSKKHRNYYFDFSKYNYTISEVDLNFFLLNMETLKKYFS